MGTFAGIKLIDKNISFKFHVVSLSLRVRPSHQKLDAKSVFFIFSLNPIIDFESIFDIQKYHPIRAVQQEEEGRFYRYRGIWRWGVHLFHH